MKEKETLIKEKEILLQKFLEKENSNWFIEGITNIPFHYWIIGIGVISFGLIFYFDIISKIMSYLKNSRDLAKENQAKIESLYETDKALADSLTKLGNGTKELLSRIEINEEKNIELLNQIKAIENMNIPEILITYNKSQKALTLAQNFQIENIEKVNETLVEISTRLIEIESQLAPNAATITSMYLLCWIFAKKNKQSVPCILTAFLFGAPKESTEKMQFIMENEEQIKLKEQEILQLKEAIKLIEKRIEINEIEYMNQLNNLIAAYTTTWTTIVLIIAAVAVIGFGLWYSGLAATIFEFYNSTDLTSDPATLNAVQNYQAFYSITISNQDQKILNLDRNMQKKFNSFVDQTQESTNQIQEEIGKQSKLINESILTTRANLEHIQKILVTDNQEIQALNDAVFLLQSQISILQNQIPNNTVAVATASLFLLCGLKKHAPKFYLGVLALRKPNDEDNNEDHGRKKLTEKNWSERHENENTNLLELKKAIQNIDYKEHKQELKNVEQSLLETLSKLQNPISIQSELPTVTEWKANFVKAAENTKNKPIEKIPNLSQQKPNTIFSNYEQSIEVTQKELEKSKTHIEGLKKATENLVDSTENLEAAIQPNTIIYQLIHWVNTHPFLSVSFGASLIVIIIILANKSPNNISTPIYTTPNTKFTNNYSINLNTDKSFLKGLPKEIRKIIKMVINFINR